MRLTFHQLCSKPQKRPQQCIQMVKKKNVKLAKVKFINYHDLLCVISLMEVCLGYHDHWRLRRNRVSDMFHFICKGPKIKNQLEIFSGYFKSNSYIIQMLFSNMNDEKNLQQVFQKKETDFAIPPIKRILPPLDKEQWLLKPGQSIYPLPSKWSSLNSHV